jgi:hypothetical protein
MAENEELAIAPQFHAVAVNATEMEPLGMESRHGSRLRCYP